jgi:hypothetical protein
VVAAALPTNADVYLDGAITPQSGLSAVKPLNASGYVVTLEGSHTITLFQMGTSTPIGGAFATSFTAGTNYTVVLLSDMTWMVFPDTNPTPASGMFTARVINLSANNNPVSVQVDTAVPPMFNAVAYKSASSSYFSAAAASHTLSIQGSTAKTITYTFQAGHVYSIYVFWDPTLNAPLIIPKSDVTPTVGTGQPSVIWIPIVQNR